MMMGDVHKRGKDCTNTSNVNQIAEQAVLMKYALGSAEQAWNNSCSSDGVKIWHDISSVEVLNTS